MNCTQCGAALVAGSRFCGSCGATAAAPAPPPPSPQYAPPPPQYAPPPPPVHNYQQVVVQPGYGAAAPAAPAKSGCLAALLGWFIPGAGQMYAGQVGCGIMALIASIVLNVGGFLLFTGAAAMIDQATGRAEEGAAVLSILAFVCFGIAWLIWLVSFIMGIVAAGKR